MGSSASFDLTNVGPAYAALVVNTTSDSLAPGPGLLSLREAIGFADTASSGNSSITFDSTVFSTPTTITLTGVQLELNSAIGTETITGPAAGATISGGGLSRVFQVDDGVTASLSGLTITGGTTASNGGGLYNLGGTITLTDCSLSGNSAAGSGGGLYSSGGTTTLTDCTLSGNTAAGSGGGAFAVGTTTITDCTLSGNSAAGSGGGLYSSGGTTTLTDCTLSGNTAAGSGGGAFAVGTTTITDCTLSGNSAAGSGGGLYSSGGTTTLTDCTLSGNTAAGSGGGAFAVGTTTMTDCTLSGNFAAGSGGGLYSSGGTTTLTDCTLSGNTAAGSGGGAFAVGTTTMTYCTLSGNSARNGGGLYNLGTTTLTDCSISGNSAENGGGLENGYRATVTLTNCTISGNSAIGTISDNSDNSGKGQGGRRRRARGYGGGLYNDQGTTTLTNVTISGNTATYGGGIDNGGTATLTNCTISGNSADQSGGGIYSQYYGYGTVNIGNTIVAGNTAATGPDIEAPVVSQGNNLIGNTSGSTGWVSSDLTGINPLLAPLGNYGGPTETLALLPGSPAIDAGNNSLIPAGDTTDQRGASFPRVVNGTADIGAFESSGFSIAVTSGSGQSTPLNTTFSDPLVVTVTAHNSDEPVAGGLVTFTPPASGASATLSSRSATIGSAGTASITATANNIGGSYAVTATASGITTPASFSLTNNTNIMLAVTKTADSSSVTVGTNGAPVGYTVTISNTNPVAATGVTLNDPLPPGAYGDIKWTIDTSKGNPSDFAISGAVGSQTLTLASGFNTLAANTSIFVHYTGTATANDTNTSTNPALNVGGIASYDVLYEGTGNNQLSITNDTIDGNIGVGGGQVQFTGPGTIGGKLDFSAANSGQYHNTNGSNVGPTSVNYNVSAVTTAINAVNSLSTSLGGLSGTSIRFNNSNQTINESSGTLQTSNGVSYRVFNVTSYSENNNDTVTINGDGSGDPVVFNFSLQQQH